MNHPEENSFAAAVERFRQTEDDVRVAAYLSAVADRHDRPASISSPSMVTTILSVDVEEPDCLIINHGRNENIILMLRDADHGLARDLADAWNVVLARHAARALPTAPGVGAAPEVRAA